MGSASVSNERLQAGNETATACRYLSQFMHLGTPAAVISFRGCADQPVHLNSVKSPVFLQCGGDTDSVYLIVADIGRPSGQGVDFINGLAFLQRFYSVFDTGNQRVGFATTPFTHATTN
ncbi:hypothetical protein JB92DRAFT_1142434 [Gautieria morchelliformis]|nr:hypothetical protein JB92DRAFT_1142434 [Gautieria morchelliformis]